MAARTMSYKKTYDTEIKFDKKFQKIIQFYLFECPVDDASARGKTLKEFGWTYHKINTLKKQLLDASTSSLRTNYYPCKKEELEEKLPCIEAVCPPCEYCVFLKYDEKRRVISSLFSAIRNAFAHGSFAVRTYNKVKIYFLANIDGYLKAEMVLHEDTLLAWINVVKGQYRAGQ